MSVFRSDHERLNERSLALHRLIAKKLQADSRLLSTARNNLSRWKQTSDNTALAEWDSILEQPVGAIIEFIQDTTERATRLRQSTPFAGILSEPERRAIYESYATRTYYSSRQQNLG